MTLFCVFLTVMAARNGHDGYLCICNQGTFNLTHNWGHSFCIRAEAEFTNPFCLKEQEHCDICTPHPLI